MAAAGFAVLSRTSDEVVIAALGRPWARGGGRAPRLAEQADPVGALTGFAAPGWAKIAVNFRVSAGELTTETRVLLTDQDSRRAFGRYWLLTRPFQRPDPPAMARCHRPQGSDQGVTGVTVRLNCWVACWPLLSVSFMVKTNVPAVVGVPAS